jgi:F0F1-type ATP synthase delta subunit
MKIPRYQVANLLGQQLIKHPVKRTLLAEQIASYLLSYGRTAELEPLLRDIVSYRAQNGVIEVTAISAHELSNQDIKDIELYARRLYPSAKTIIMNSREEPNLIGGVRLEIVSQQLDLSIRTKLNQLKKLTMSERTAT